jgi:hypothetical protein
MRYVEYYTRDENGDYQEVCGDRGMVVLDARNSIKTSMQDAIQFNGFRRPVFDAYRLFQGENCLRSTPITNIIDL